MIWKKETNDTVRELLPFNWLFSKNVICKKDVNDTESRLIWKKEVTLELLPSSRLDNSKIAKIWSKMALTSLGNRHTSISWSNDLAHCVELNELKILIPISPNFQNLELLPFSRSRQYCGSDYNGGHLDPRQLRSYQDQVMSVQNWGLVQICYISLVNDRCCPSPREDPGDRWWPSRKQLELKLYWIFKLQLPAFRKRLLKHMVLKYKFVKEIDHEIVVYILNSCLQSSMLYCFWIIIFLYSDNAMYGMSTW